MFGRVLAFLYGLVCYLIFLISFLYAIAFVGNIGLVPKTIDSGPAAPLERALIINALLLSLFAIRSHLPDLVPLRDRVCRKHWSCPKDDRFRASGAIGKSADHQRAFAQSIRDPISSS